MAKRNSEYDREDQRRSNRGHEQDGARIYVNQQSERGNRDDDVPRHVEQSEWDRGQELGNWGDDQRFRTRVRQSDPNEDSRNWNERERTRSEYGRYGENAPRMWSDEGYRQERERHEGEQRTWAGRNDREQGRWREPAARDRNEERNRDYDRERWVTRTPGEGGWREWQDRNRNRDLTDRDLDFQNRIGDREPVQRDFNADRQSREWDRDRYREEQGYGIREHITRSPEQERYDRVRRDETLTERVGRFIGVGPKGYRRSDERIREDVSERLEDHPDINAAGIEVTVKDAEVTLSGTVDNRLAKRLAEDEASSCRGVKDVHNQIRVTSERGEVQREGGKRDRDRAA